MVAYSIASRYSANRPHDSLLPVSTVGSGAAIESRQRRPDAGALAGVALIVARVMGKRRRYGQSDAREWRRVGPVVSQLEIWRIDKRSRG